MSGFEARNIMKYNPRQNGVVERFVVETKRVLMKWLHRDVSGWEYYIPAMILWSLVGQTLEHTQQTKHNYLKLSVYQSRQEKNSELFIDTSVP